MGQIQRRSFLSVSAGLMGGGLMAARQGRSQDHQTATGNLRHQARTVSLMTDAANRFLGSLDAEQKAKGIFPFAGEERMHWAYTPGARKGLMLSELYEYQKHLANALLAAGLSQEGYIKAVTILSLHNNSGHYLSIFGTPSDTEPWGYRVDGLHLSQNYTIVNGQAVDGPSFFGAQPAHVTDTVLKQLEQQKVQFQSGMRTLAQEEDLGFEMIRSLDEPLQKIAVVDPKAYEDIRTVNSRKAALMGQPSGLLASKMTSKQFDVLRALAELYARNLPDEIARRRMNQIDAAKRNAWFAWAGATTPGVPHYYRVQTESFLIEFDNLGADANHIHSVWRDFAGDWGGDLLETHYQESHRPEKA
jgi:hypothetical protein